MYLGVTFTHNVSFTKHKNRLLEQGRKAMFCNYLLMYFVQRGLSFDSARLWPPLGVTQVRKSL